MTIEEAIRLAASTLTETDTPTLDARLLAKHVTGLDDAGLILHAANHLSAKQRQEMEAMVNRRRAGEPIAYIIGRREFWSLEFEVGEGVLVPRADSETLIEAALEAFPDKQTILRVLDLGVGSGCLLAAFLSERPCATGVGVDRRPVALEYAKRNLDRLGLSGRATLKCGDWGRALGEADINTFDLILTNPPYIAEADRASLARDVREYEDAGALFGGHDGLQEYPSILTDSARFLRPSGVIVMEFGVGQSRRIVELAREAFACAEISLKNDLSARPRVIVIKR